jgi:Na+/proline symporter
VRAGVAIVVGIYFAALIAWCLYKFVTSYRRGGETEESRYVGARSFGTGALVATFVAAWASNYTLLAAAESGYNFGLSGPIWYALGVGLPILFFIWPINIVARIRESMPEGVTMIEYVGRRYDERSRLVALVTVLISSILYIISVILGVGIVLSSLLDIGMDAAIMIGGAVLILYTALGGFEATVRSHVYQLGIAGLGVAVALILTVRDTGLQEFVAGIPQEQLNVLGWGPLSMIDFFLALTALTIASPVIWQRLFAARDTRSATRAIAWFPVAWMPFAVGSGIMGLAAFRLLPEIDPSAAATRLVVDLFPTWAAVLFLLGGLALVFSSGDAAINNVASIVQIDILDNYLGLSPSRLQNLYVSFALQVGLGVVGVVGALRFESILELLVINSAINIALIFPLYLGLVWSGANSFGAFWSILLSLAIGGTMILLQVGPLANLTALLISGVVLVGLSYLSRARPAEEAPATAGLGARRKVPGVVVGALGAVALYALLYALASAYDAAVLEVPPATAYPLLVYALIGCVAMVTVLPFFALLRDK